LKKYFDFNFVGVEYPKFSTDSDVKIEFVLTDDYTPSEYLSPIAPVNEL